MAAAENSEIKQGLADGPCVWAERRRGPDEGRAPIIGEERRELHADEQGQGARAAVAQIGVIDLDSLLGRNGLAEGKLSRRPVSPLRRGGRGIVRVPRLVRCRPREHRGNSFGGVAHPEHPAGGGECRVEPWKHEEVLGKFVAPRSRAVSLRADPADLVPCGGLSTTAGGATGAGQQCRPCPYQPRRRTFTLRRSAGKRVEYLVFAQVPG